jgi:hypothetical protein
MRLPVEEVHPHDPTLVLVDLDTAKNSAVLARPERLLLLGCRRQPCNETDKVQREGRGHLIQLVLGIFVLGKQVFGGSELFLAHKDRSSDGREDERVQKTKGKGLVLLWDDGSQKGRNHREEDDADLSDLHNLEAARGIIGKADELHDCVVDGVLMVHAMKERWWLNKSGVYEGKASL